MAYEPPLDEWVPAGDLVDTLARKAALEGPNRTEWRGLTRYRFERPQTPHWEEVRSLSLCVVIQGRQRVRIGGHDYVYDPFNYFVMTRGLRFQAEIMEASPAKPLLSFVLQVVPAVVNRVVAEINERAAVLYQRNMPSAPAAFVIPFDALHDRWRRSRRKCPPGHGFRAPDKQQQNPLPGGPLRGYP